MKPFALNPWPRAIPRHFSDRVKLLQSPLDGLLPAMKADVFAQMEARRRKFLEAEATGLTNTYNETYFINSADHSAVANTTSETSLLAGTNQQPYIPANYFLQQGSQLRGLRILARGVLSTTSTPTLIFQARLGTTSGSTYLSGASIGVSAAITTAAGVTNKWWELRLDLICRVGAIGTGNATLAGSGYVTSPGGFAAPYIYPLEPTTPDTATWTQTFDASLTQFVNLSVTWSAASASNTIICKQLMVDAIG